MVNITALEKIIRFIDGSYNLRTMKKWSERFRIENSQKKNKYLRKLINKVRNVLNLISGYDIVEMPKGFNLKIFEIVQFFNAKSG